VLRPRLWDGEGSGAKEAVSAYDHTEETALAEIVESPEQQRFGRAKTGVGERAATFHRTLTGASPSSSLTSAAG